MYTALYQAQKGQAAAAAKGASTRVVDNHITNLQQQIAKANGISVRGNVAQTVNNVSMPQYETDNTPASNETFASEDAKNALNTIITDVKREQLDRTKIALSTKNAASEKYAKGVNLKYFGDDTGNKLSLESVGQGIYAIREGKEILGYTNINNVSGITSKQNTGTTNKTKETYNNGPAKNSEIYAGYAAAREAEKKQNALLKAQEEENKKEEIIAAQRKDLLSQWSNNYLKNQDSVKKDSATSYNNAEYYAAKAKDNSYFTGTTPEIKKSHNIAEVYANRAEVNSIYKGTTAQRNTKPVVANIENKGGDRYTYGIEYNGLFYPGYKQSVWDMTDSGCCPTALAIVLKGLGKDVDPSRVASKMLSLGTWNGSHATDPYYSVSRTLDAYGIDYKASSNGPGTSINKEQFKKDLREAIIDGKPVVVDVNRGYSGGNSGHYIVILGEDENGNLIISNPGGKPQSENDKKYGGYTSASGKSIRPGAMTIDGIVDYLKGESRYVVVNTSNSPKVPKDYDDVLMAKNDDENMITPEKNNALRSPNSSNIPFKSQNDMELPSKAEFEKAAASIKKNVGTTGEIYGGTDEVMASSSTSFKLPDNGVNAEEEMVWPVDDEVGYITSTYGPRKQPKPGASKYHEGIDIGVGGKEGTPVVAAKSGVVKEAGNKGNGYGNYIIIDHGDGTETQYSHLQNNSLKVTAGQTVEQGQEIAGVGNTGVSTGPHLDFRVSVDGEKVNPMEYLPEGYE